LIINKTMIYTSNK